jgi:hypothetical protein
MPIRPSVFPSSYQRYFDSHTDPLHIVPINPIDLNLVVNKYNSLLKELTQLLLHPNR